MAISGDLILCSDGDQYRQLDCSNLGAAHCLARSANAGGKRAQVRFRLLCKTTKQVTGGILYIGKQWRLQLFCDAFRQADAVYESDAETAENRRPHACRMFDREKCRDARAH